MLRQRRHAVSPPRYPCRVASEHVSEAIAHMVRFASERAVRQRSTPSEVARLCGMRANSAYRFFGGTLPVFDETLPVANAKHAVGCVNLATAIAVLLCLGVRIELSDAPADDPEIDSEEREVATPD